MDLKSQIKTLNVLYKIVNGNTPIMPPKPPLKELDGVCGFEEVLPEQAGVRSEGLLKMFAELSADRSVCPHSAIVLRGGKLIAKADWSPFSSRFMHVSHSLCKSIVSMAVGIAAEEKYISEDERLTDIFAGYEVRDKKMSEVTVKRLLTMSSGVRFNEVSSAVSEDWTGDFLRSEVQFEPGSEFSYNSLNTYMLSAALCLRTGMSLSEYLNRRLFKPMGITDFYWEKSPGGAEKGGWGLYMGICDYAKLGQLYLDGGVWNGVSLVPAEWVAKSSSKLISKAHSPCYEGYGYQIWRTKNNDGFVFSGMLGQNVFVYPARKMVIAITAGSSNLFPPCRAMDIITGFIENKNNFSNEPIKNFRYANAALLRNALAEAEFGKPLRIGGRQSLFERLKQSLSHTAAADSIPEAALLLEGTEVVFEKNRAGLLPVLIQFMNGNFAKGIEKAAFTSLGKSGVIPSYKRFVKQQAVYGNERSGRFAVRFEGGGETVTVPVSFSGKPVYFDLEYGGDSFRAAVNGSFTTDEDSLPVLKLVICFVETSCTKILKFIFESGGVTLKMRESPQLYSALDEAAEIVKPYIGKTAEKAVDAILETDIAEYKIKSFLEPTLRGKMFTPL